MPPTHVYVKRNPIHPYTYNDPNDLPFIQWKYVKISVAYNMYTRDFLVFSFGSKDPQQGISNDETAIPQRGHPTQRYSAQNLSLGVLGYMILNLVQQKGLAWSL